MTVFDQNGNPVPVYLPISTASASWPLSLLGGNPGPSVIGALVIPNIQTQATSLSASLSLGTNSSGLATAALQVPIASQSTAAWSYVQSGSNWVAQSVTVTPALSGATSSHTFQFANLNWNNNATNNAARAAAGSTVQAPPSPVTTSPGALPTPAADPAPAATGPTFVASNCNTNVYDLGGAQNVAFLHGLNSTSCSWGEMANWLNSDFRFKTEVIPSLETGAGIATQGQELISEMNSVGGSGYIFVGHSQGGLAARYAAQYFQNLQTTTGESTPVFGVVTVDTPHQGTPAAAVLQPITTVGFAAAGLELWQQLGCSLPTDNWGCYFAAALTGASPLLAGAVWSPLSGALTDLSPGSAALNSLNSDALTGGAPENFKQAAIIGQTPWQFDEVRWIEEFILGHVGCDGPSTYCCDPDTSLCGENAVATGVRTFWDELVITVIILEIEQVTWCLFDDNCPCIPPPGIQAAINFLLKIIVWMEIPDYAWNVAVNGSLVNLASDALVPVPSQYYPASTASNYYLPVADSHSGALRSVIDRAQLDSILAAAPFDVPTQSGCGFSVSGSPITFTGNGGTDSFAVTTGAGCYWNAVSQTSWISVTSAGNGSSDGTVSFSAAANPVTVPRQGTIKVGNGASSAFFTVNEQGACYYSLSEGPVVAVPPGGATNTVEVTTASTDCPWSAVSNAAWLTITAGGIGTGSGSFT